MMKKRTAAIGLLMSLLPLGQPLVIKTGVALTTAGLIFSIPEEVNAESAVSYYNQGNNKYDAGDYSGAISDYSKVIEINPNHVYAYGNRGVEKNKIGDIKGACSDWTQASELGNEDAARWIKEYCQ